MGDVFVTLAQVKTYLKITDTNSDALITALLQPMTDTILSMLGVANLSEHVVTNERTEVYEYRKFYLKDFPVNLAETFTIKNLDNEEITDKTFQKDPGALRQIYIYDSDSVRSTINYGKILVSYTAGYTYASASSNSVPDVFKLAVSLMVGGSMEDSENIAEYAILDKRVKFKNGKDRNLFKTVMDQYIIQYKSKISILS